MRVRLAAIALLAAVGPSAPGLAIVPPAGAGHDAVPAVAGIRSDYVKRLMDSGGAVVLIDMRKPGEFAAGHLPGARSLPIGELDRRFREIPASARVVLYCDCPLEEIATAYAFLKRQGFRNHAVLEDGFAGWLRQRYPVTRQPAAR